jgi:uncharacterized protein (DUF1330 family)
VSAYVISSYRVTNPQAFGDYPPRVIPTILSNGGEILVADFESEALEGEPPHVTIVVRFDSKDAARAWLASPEYAEIKHLRTENTEATATALVNEFVMPE